MIYLDNSATTKPYKEVLNSYLTVSTDYYGNPSSIHSMGGEAEKLLHRSRETIASLLSVHHKEVIFTSGGTESNNLAIKGSALSKKSIGNHIITTSIEHPSVINAIKDLEAEGFDVTILPVDKDGRISTEQVKAAIRKETVLISIIHVNNETGVIQPVKEIGELLANYPQVTFHVDHIQGIGKVTLNMQNIDLCSLSAHKFHGLKGNGILIAKSGVKLHPILSGGNQEWTLRSGTENVAGIVAMTKALRMTLEKGENGLSEMQALKNFCIHELKKMDGVFLHTPETHSAPHIINFSVPGIKSEVLVHALGSKKVFVSTTSACSSKRKAPSKTLMAMGVSREKAESAIRVSMTYHTTKQEIQTFLHELEDAIITIKEVTR
ncbi:cysteine desulfurase family protein [Sutcliffiella horikoshii]|uniref:cysteine desulfurase family protein n=1 Tax=Sutcliffiella horikoshii TaxID=79883 RepID=UPI001F2F4FBE|nr:cysteine desulfurase family protein [Sutcliffiella horikoshii]MCG1022038.1 cysteine desulfurase [Sutcliffiella horikoshii]